MYNVQFWHADRYLVCYALFSQQCMHCASLGLVEEQQSVNFSSDLSGFYGRHRNISEGQLLIENKHQFLVTIF